MKFVKDICSRFSILIVFLIIFNILSMSAKDSYIYSIKVKTIDGKEQALSEYKGKVILIVNVASKCGFAKQYKALEELYDKYKNKGFVILGFPCNQFGEQEPGTNEEIKQFCSVNYGVSFPLFEKLDVNGDNTHPLYKYLKNAKPGLLGSQSIKWNFTKFLVDKYGNVVYRFASQTTPESLSDDIEKLLNK